MGAGLRTGACFADEDIGDHLQPLPPMLRWSLMFFVFGLIAALLGFTGIAGAAIGIAKILFFVFAVLFLVTLLIALMATPRGSK